MKKLVTSLIFLLVCAVVPHQLLAVEANPRLNELDAFWSELARTVREGDFEAYSANYHDDAVVVSMMDSLPIAKALAAWKAGFVSTKTGATKADVQFRFTKRVGDATTAHETGLFHYTATDSSGKSKDAYVYFEALLVKKRSWKFIMEYQKNAASKAEWEAAK